MTTKSYLNTEWKFSRVKSAVYDSIFLFGSQSHDFNDIAPNLQESSIISQFDGET